MALKLRRPSSPTAAPNGPSDIALAEWDALGLDTPDIDALRLYRLNRVVAEIGKRGYGGILCFDPLNIRYITDCPNMQLWVMHNPCRAAFVAASGYVMLWDFDRCEHLSADLPLVTETRSGAGAPAFSFGEKVTAAAGRFAEEVASEMFRHAGAELRLAVDRADGSVLFALQAAGLRIEEGQPAMEKARAIKSGDEIAAIRCAITACEASVDEMRAALEPGISEVELWSHLHAGNIKRGGGWIETRLLTSGPRTNPWYQECGPRIIEAGDIVAFDTDLIGCYDYCVDFSRSWITGTDKASDGQRRIHDIAVTHVEANIALMLPGTPFAEVTAKSHRLPEEYLARRYSVIGHGVGLADECPALRYPEDSGEFDPEGQLEPGMVMAVEAFVGSESEREGVKHEEMILITETGNERLTHFPLDPAFAP